VSDGKISEREQGLGSRTGGPINQKSAFILHKVGNTG
jgi:hypothetical protein